MATVSYSNPWWRRLLRRWWKVESVCCLWARPVMTKAAYECGWCGRLTWLRDLDEPVWGPSPLQGSALYWKRLLVEQEKAGIVGGRLSEAQAERFRRHLIERSVLMPRMGDGQ